MVRSNHSNYPRKQHEYGSSGRGALVCVFFKKPSDYQGEGLVLHTVPELWRMCKAGEDEQGC